MRRTVNDKFYFKDNTLVIGEDNDRRIAETTAVPVDLAPIYLRALTKERTSPSFSLPGRTKRPRNGINPRRTDNPNRQSYVRSIFANPVPTDLSIVAAKQFRH